MIAVVLKVSCLGCYGSGRFGPQPQGNANGPWSGKCFRCKGSGIEPADEVCFIAEINRRVAARRQSEAQDAAA